MCNALGSFQLSPIRMLSPLRSQLICLPQGETAVLVTALSLVQSVSRGHAGALQQKATQYSAGFLHSISVCSLTGKKGLFLVERTHCRAQTSAGKGKNPPDGGDEGLLMSMKA